MTQSDLPDTVYFATIWCCATLATGCESTVAIKIYHVGTAIAVCGGECTSPFLPSP